MAISFRLGHVDSEPSMRAVLAAVVILATACASAEPSTSRSDAVAAWRSMDAPTTDDRPNVLIIMTDDQRATGTMRAMPATRRWFGKHGVTYTNAFATTPLCCPARSSLFTGQYVHNHGVTANSEANNLDPTRTLQAYLQRRGYFTALSGKYLNAWGTTAPPYFNRFAILTSKWGPESYTTPTFNFDGTVRRVYRYSTTVIQKRAVGMLRSFDRRADAKPWLMYMTPFAPHEPAIPAPRHVGVRVSKWDPAPSVFERDRTDKPPVVRSETVGLREQRRLRRRMLRSLMSVDDMVARVMRTLKELDESTRTIAFFLSDNGWLWGEHGLEGKRLPYAESVRIPFYMRWPGHTVPGTEEDRFVANIDIAPTVLDALDFTPPVPMDGRALLAPDARDRMFMEHYADADIPSWASVWTLEHQYTEWYDGNGDRIFRELYDRAADPYQMVNLLAGERDPPSDQLPSLEAGLEADRSCVGSACP
jgi:arylsulfatase A-like enzyme